MADFVVPEFQAFFDYDVQLKVFKNGSVSVKRYLDKLKRKKSGYELLENNSDISIDSGTCFKKQKFKKNDSVGEILKKNLVRSRNLLIDYASENEKDFRSFITLTFRENLQDINIANREFNKYISKVKRVFPDFMYLGVPEFQKRGAVHYHLVTNLVPGSDLLPLQNGEKNKYDVKYWLLGFSSVFNLNMADDNFNVALYMCKYMFKDFDNRLYGRQKILHSNNLSTPNVFYLQRNSAVYINAMEYIKKKGYSITEYTFVPDESFQIPFDVVNCKVADIDEFDSLLNI